MHCIYQIAQLLEICICFFKNTTYFRLPVSLRVQPCILEIADINMDVLDIMPERNSIIFLIFYTLIMLLLNVCNLKALFVIYLNVFLLLLIKFVLRINCIQNFCVHIPFYKSLYALITAITLLSYYFQVLLKVTFVKVILAVPSNGIRFPISMYEVTEINIFHTSPCRFENVGVPRI